MRSPNQHHCNTEVLFTYTEVFYLPLVKPRDLLPLKRQKSDTKSKSSFRIASLSPWLCRFMIATDSSLTHCQFTAGSSLASFSCSTSGGLHPAALSCQPCFGSDFILVKCCLQFIQRPERYQQRPPQQVVLLP